VPARSRLALGALAALLLPHAASPIDRFEIQVYEAEVNEPGDLGLEVHANYTARGTRTPAYPGEIPPHRAFRLTLEPAVGVARWLELGGYLLTVAAPGEGYRFAGAKLRAKLVAPREERGLFYGLNVEVGRVPHAVSDEGWANEFRPILGWGDGTWLLDLNPIFGFSLSGAERFRPDLEPAAKVSWNTQRGFALGVEWYAELGFVDALLPASRQAHYAFLVLDLAAPAGGAAGPWELNLAVGGGVTSAADQQLLVKVIVGRGLPRLDAAPRPRPGP
jgi:hypothetical protein